MQQNTPTASKSVKGEDKKIMTYIINIYNVCVAESKLHLGLLEMLCYHSK